MLLRQVLIAALLVSGTAAVAAAQSDEFPFRRFGGRHWVEPRHDFRMRDFSFRNSARLRFKADRLRMRLEERTRDLTERTRNREFYLRDNAMRLRNRGFVLRGQTRRHQMELGLRGMDRIRDRVRERMDHFRFERPLIMRRHSRTI